MAQGASLSDAGQKEDIEPFREKDVVMDWLKTASPSERCQAIHCSQLIINVVYIIASILSILLLHEVGKRTPCTLLLDSSQMNMHSDYRLPVRCPEPGI